MHFLPHFPIYVNPVALFGLILLLGLMGGELARRSPFLPSITGYFAIGFICGPNGFDIVPPALLANTRIFVDISLGLILFNLGKHLDFAWLRHDRGILKMSAAESMLTFIFVTFALLSFHVPYLQALLAATIAVATSPGVVMMIANDLSSKGPVTRRTLILTSLNNLFAMILFTLLLPITESHTRVPALIILGAYRLLGSFALGMITFFLTISIASFIGKRKENQFVLLVGSVIFSIGLAAIFNLSSMLTLFVLGVAARNFDRHHVLIEIDFNWLARLFFILLFVITGVHLQLKGLWQTTALVVAFLTARTMAKSCGIWLFARKSRLTSQQGWALCLTLTPMAGVAIGMSTIISDFNPALGYELMITITTVVAILNIIGPIATQFAFIKSKEVVAVEN
jgi:Kef-type K+ transport system membrane component KefB